jgi:hypothetical protein
MTPLDPELRSIIDELATAVQTAIGLATRLRRETQTITDDAVSLEAAIGRAVVALRRLQPSRRGES